MGQNGDYGQMFRRFSEWEKFNKFRCRSDLCLNHISREFAEVNFEDRVFQGEIWLADLDSEIGSIQGGKRPVIVLQNNIVYTMCNEYKIDTGNFLVQFSIAILFFEKSKKHIFLTWQNYNFVYRKITRSNL